MSLPADITADSFAESEQFLLQWERVTASRINGFRTSSLDTVSGKVTRRALLVDGRSVWMLNLISPKGGDQATTRRIFERVLRSLNVNGTEPMSP